MLAFTVILFKGMAKKHANTEETLKAGIRTSALATLLFISTHPQQVGRSSDAHARDGLSLSFGEATVPRALAGEGDE